MENTLIDRITIDPNQMGGEPCIRHLRIPVVTILRLMANGHAWDEILAWYPDLDADDLKAVSFYLPN